MKNLDLNAYGVSEMSLQEMVETDGGGFWGKLVEVIVGGIVYDVVKEVAKEAGEALSQLGAATAEVKSLPYGFPPK